MKKIFAIALALVMVLSMASAFASPCTSGFVWAEDPAATNCGKATVEVVPYVKVNNSCGGYDWQVSTCASAVNSEKVYYAVKLNVEANADNAWFDTAAVALSYKGLEATTAPALANLAGVPEYLVTKDVEDKANTFYYNFILGGWELVEDSFTLDGDNVKEEVSKKASEAKVCAKLTAKLGDFTRGVVGDYYVKVLHTGEKEGVMLVVDADDAAKVEGISSSILGSLSGVTDIAGLAALIPVENAVGYIYVNGEVAVVGKLNDKCSTSFYNNVTSFFGIELGTKMTTKLINKNFGWDEKQESCFSWSDKAASIVDAECVVAIPKTGDASVLAWLF